MIFKFISYWPKWFVYLIADVLGFFVFKVFMYRKAVIRENISTCFPEFSEHEVRKTADAFGRQFFHVLGEAIFCYHFKEKDWEERIVVENARQIKEYLGQNKTVLMVYGHMTNWEWPMVSLGKVLGVSTEFLYRPMENDAVDQSLLKFREKHGGKGLHKDKAIRHILKHRNLPRAIGLVADQVPSLGTEKRWLSFFGKETAFYVGVEKIALATNSPVFFIDVNRTSRGKYHYVFHEIAKPPYTKESPKIIEAYANKLEKNIRKNPSGYLWSHRRWKYTKAEDLKIKTD